MMTGPQADFWYPVNPSHAAYTGQFYSENTTLGILAWRGQVTESEPGKSQRLLGNSDALGGYVKINDWNQYEIIARGGTFIHILNGQLMAIYVDDDPDSSNNVAGLIGFEVEGIPAKSPCAAYGSESLSNMHGTPPRVLLHVRRKGPLARGTGACRSDCRRASHDRNIVFSGY